MDGRTQLSSSAPPWRGRPRSCSATSRHPPRRDRCAPLEPFPYAFGSPATGGLYRLTGPGWSWFWKVLQSVRHWPLLKVLPPDVRAVRRPVPVAPRARALGRGLSEQAARRPAGAGAPRRRRARRRPGDGLDGGRRRSRRRRATSTSTPGPPLRALERAVRRPGAGRRTTSRRWDALRMYASEAVAPAWSRPLEDDELWSHPWLRDHAGLRGRPRWLAPRTPGDARPARRLRADHPARRREPPEPAQPGRRPRARRHRRLVPHARAAGLRPRTAPRGAHACRPGPGRDAARHRRPILTAYVDALAAEGLTGLDDDVRDAFTTSVLLRSGFDSFLFDLIGSDDPADRHTFDERVALCRFLADQYLELHPDD